MTNHTPGPYTIHGFNKDCPDTCDIMGEGSYIAHMSKNGDKTMKEARATAALLAAAPELLAALEMIANTRCDAQAVAIAAIAKAGGEVK
jgi:hypothetical protein